MRKIYVLLSAVLLLKVIVAAGQDCTFYFPVKTGTEIELNNYNAKDKLVGSVKSRVIEQTSNSVKFSSEVFDKKGKSVSKGEYLLQCKNGEYVIDMSSFLKGVNMEAYKDMDVNVVATELTIPAQLKEGQQLNDGSINMKISNQGMGLMNMTVNITNRKVEGFEEITTPAGTFKCARISYDIDTKMMLSSHHKVIEWISEKVGVVRSESYDDKGKLNAYSVLASIKD